MPAKNRGFTLIETLVSVSIVALLAVLVLPNLRSFNNDQVVNSNLTNLLNALKQTQTNAQSGIACPNNLSTTSWVISLTNTSYTVYGNCIDTVPTPPVLFTSPPTISYTYSPSTIQTNPTTFSCTLTFKGGGITITSGTCSTFPITVTLNDSASGISKSLTIDAGGAIYTN